MVKTRYSAAIEAATFSVGLHTDQQSLILGEMMTARNKLQEENQMLRDQLQDAQMMIQLLKLKLTEKKIDLDLPKVEGRPASPKRKSKVGSVLRPIGKNIVDTKHKSSMPNLQNKHAFRNQVAPGKRTFEPKGRKTTSTLSKTVVSVLQSPRKFRSKLDVSCSPDSRLAEPEGEQRPNYVPTTSTLLSSRKSNPAYVYPFFGEEQFPGDAQQMRSVVGKLAQVVLNEYSTTEDDEENIIFE
jgi:hypothetical protein